MTPVRVYEDGRVRGEGFGDVDIEGDVGGVGAEGGGGDQLEGGGEGGYGSGLAEEEEGGGEEGGEHCWGYTVDGIYMCVYM